MKTAERIASAIRNYGGLAPGAMSVEAAGDYATPDPLGYAFGWIAACAIVGTRYRDTALDALPVYHPEHGWDRFLLTRRVSCDYCADEPADAFGSLLIGGEDRLALAKPDGGIALSLSALYRDDPERAKRSLLAHLPPPALPPGDHTACPHARAAAYPALVTAIADLIVTQPGVIAARELFIDDRQVDGAYHPLYVHTAGRTVGHVYDWLAVSYGARTVFVRAHGEQVIHEVTPGVWRSESTTFSPDDPDAIGYALRAWLRLDVSS